MRFTGLQSTLLLHAAKTTVCLIMLVMHFSCQDYSVVNRPADAWDSFDRDTQGWQSDGGCKLSFSPAGGNFGGYLNGEDNAVGIWYYVASDRIVKALHNGYGKTLSFDLEQSAVDAQFDADDIVVTDGVTTLTYNTTSNPATTWTPYDIKLDEQSGWKKGKTAVKKAELLQVLSNLTSLKIRGEYRLGHDKGGLDNVSLR